MATIEIRIGVTGLAGAYVVDVYPVGNDTAAATALAIVEQTNRKGTYRATISGVSGNHEVYVRQSADPTKILYDGTVAITDDGGNYRVDGAGDLPLSTRSSQASVTALSTAVVTAHASVVGSDSSSPPADIWEVVWNSDSVAQSGIADATLTVRDSANTVILNAVAMTEVGTSGHLKYVATGEANRIQPGTSYSVTVTATVGGTAYTQTLVGISRDR